MPQQKVVPPAKLVNSGLNSSATQNGDVLAQNGHVAKAKSVASDTLRGSSNAGLSTSLHTWFS